MELRIERATDHRLVDEVILAAFGDHARVVAPLAADIRASIADRVGLSLVAEHEDAVIGHVMFSPGLLDAPRRLVAVQVLSPVSVLPSWQHNGVGTALIRHGLELLIDHAVPVVFVEGDPAYYSRLGFRPAEDLGYRRPSLRIPKRAFQAIQLPTHEPWMTGTFVYSSVFWDHDAVGLRNADFNSAQHPHPLALADDPK